MQLLVIALAAGGDRLVLDPTTAWKPWPIRPLTAARPAAYQRLNDPGRGPTAVQRQFLWDFQLAIESIAKRLAGCRVVRTVSDSIALTRG